MMQVTHNNIPEALMFILQRIDELERSMQTKDRKAEKSNVYPITIDQAAKITGLRKQTIYNKVSKDQIPHERRGGRLYFYESKLKEWMMSESLKNVKKSTQEKVDNYLNCGN